MISHPSHYRADIDGLRAVSIFGVLLFHINTTWVKGGFLGVDVFL
jgi:peptidoglycan/LPS O-acetylase OafA/YrhL